MSELRPTKPDKVAQILEKLEILRSHDDIVSRLTKELHRGIISDEFYRDEMLKADGELDEAIAQTEKEYTTSPERPFIKTQIGFTCVGRSESHAVYHHTDGRWTTVPIHKGRNLGKGILRKILKDAKITVDEFEKLR